MRGIMIKCDREHDRYVFWSTICEAPHTHGDREHMTRYLDLFGHFCDGMAGITAMLDRADGIGTSAGPGWYDWDDDTLIVEQRGTLRREKLWDFCEAYYGGPGRRDEWLDMLDPFDDCFEHDQPGQECPVLPCPDHVVRRD